MSIPSDQTELREVIRARYAAVATVATGERGELPESAVLASLGCGNPIAVAERRAPTCTPTPAALPGPSPARSSPTRSKPPGSPS